MRSPIEMLIDNAGLRCTICFAKMGECDCWTPCVCGWSYRKGGRCDNPIHGKKGGRPPKKRETRAPSYHTCSGNCLCSIEGRWPHSPHCACNRPPEAAKKAGS